MLINYRESERDSITIKGVPSAESSRSVRGLGKGVSGKPYPRLCNARRLRLEPGTFRSQAVRLYRLHQARPSDQEAGTNLLLSPSSACYNASLDPFVPLLVALTSSEVKMING